MIWVLYYTLLIFFPGVKPQTSYRWVCQGEGSSDLFRCGKCESRCGRPAGPHAPSLDEREVLSDPNPKRIKKMARTCAEPTFGACVQLRQAKAEVFCHFVNFVQWWPTLRNHGQSLVLWAGSRLLKNGNLIRNSPSPAMKFVGSRAPGFTKRVGSTPKRIVWDQTDWLFFSSRNCGP